MSRRWLEVIESGPCKGTFRLCGEHLPHAFVKPGQTWMDSGNAVVQVDKVDNDNWVHYFWNERVLSFNKRNYL